MIFTSDSCVALALRVPRSFLATVILFCALLYSCGAGRAQEIRLVVTDIVGLEELQTEYGAFQKVLGEVSGIALLLPSDQSHGSGGVTKAGAHVDKKLVEKLKAAVENHSRELMSAILTGKDTPEIQRHEIHYASNCSMSIRRLPNAYVVS